MKKSSIENKDLLLKVLCGGLLYGVKIFVHCPESHINNKPFTETLTYDYLVSIDASIDGYYDGIDTMIVKPYLRQMSSMTEEERKEYKHLVAFSGSPDGAANFVDWLNVHHFDYRGLIEKGLALEAPEGMY